VPQGQFCKGTLIVLPSVSSKKQNNIVQSRLGFALHSGRKSQNLTQAGLAERAGLSIPTIRLLEKGQGNLSSWQACLSVLELVLIGRQLPQGEHIGHQIATLRKRRLMGQRAIAALANVSQPTLVQLERHFAGRLDTLERVLTLLGVSSYLAPAGEPRSFYEHAGNSSIHHGWHTPPEILKPLYGVFDRFDLDPCSSTANPRRASVKAQAYFTIEDDGLSLDWFGTVFMNPPYGRELSHWVHKGRKEVTEGRARAVVALIPARTDTKWWHRDIAPFACTWFLRGRLKFGDAENSAPFPSALIGWGLAPKQREALSAAFPTAWAS